MAKKKLDVTAAYQELETLAAWFERGEPDLEAGLEKFERASELVKSLQERLQEAEQKIKLIRVSSQPIVEKEAEEDEDDEDSEDKT